MSAPASPARLDARVVPSLLVRDMAETLAFYARLGFRATGWTPEQAAPVWAEVQRDAAVLQFYVDPPKGTPTRPVLSGTLYFYPESVDALAAEFRTKVDLAWGPEIMDYGMREFGIQDPNGYYLAFTEPA